MERTGCMFFPLVVETLGVWSPNSLKTLKRIARTILSTRKTVSKAISNLHQQFSVRLWQYNARMILERLAICNVNSDFGEIV